MGAAERARNAGAMDRRHHLKASAVFSGLCLQIRHAIHDQTPASAFDYGTYPDDFWDWLAQNRLCFMPSPCSPWKPKPPAGSGS
jgi:hypothetical protein